MSRFMLAALVLAACGGDDGGGTTTDARPVDTMGSANKVREQESPPRASKACNATRRFVGVSLMAKQPTPDPW